MLREIGQTTGWAKHLYFVYLIQQAQLDPPTLARALDQAGREVQSDFELRIVLQHAATRFTLDSTTGASYATATREVESDFEQRHALGLALAQPTLPADAAGSLLKVAAVGLQSDFEAAELLVQVPPHTIAAAVSPYLDALNTIDSDFEHRKTLTALIGRPNLSASLLDGALRSAGAHMDSDFELASFLLEYAKKQGLAETHRKRFFEAVRTIGSDFERRRVLTALAARPGLHEADIATIAASTGEMGSDFERAEVLLAVVARQRLTPAARDAVLGAARQIGSDHERGRVLSTMLQRGELASTATR